MAIVTVSVMRRFVAALAPRTWITTGPSMYTTSEQDPRCSTHTISLELLFRVFDGYRFRRIPRFFADARSFGGHICRAQPGSWATFLKDDDGNCRLRIVVHSTDVCSVTQQCRSSSKNVSRNRHVSVERRIGWGRLFASADHGIC